MTKKLAVFDIDGTIAVNGEISQSVFDGLQSLRNSGYITTLSTGRAHLRILYSFEDVLDKLVSKDALIITEHGTKITDYNGNVVFAEYFTGPDISHIVDFLRSNQEIIDYVIFYLPKPTDKPKIWTKNDSDIQRVRQERGNYYDIFHSNFTELGEVLSKSETSCIKAVLKNHVYVQNLKLKLTRSQTTLNFQDGYMEFMKSNTNKGLAVSYLKNHFGVSDDNLIVAGNAINDQEMLNTPAKHRILVGPEDVRKTIMPYLFDHSTVTEIQSPEELGYYLQKLK